MVLSDSELNNLRDQFPLTVANLLALAGGREALAHVVSLDRRWAELVAGTPPPDVIAAGEAPPTAADYDVVVAGGSLGLLTALALAKRGWRVAVFDQRTAGSAHREWNISAEELSALVRDGLFEAGELQTVTMRHYRTGLVRFAAGEAPQHDLWIDDVLDVAIDAGALLRLTRGKLEAAGVPILDHRAFQRVWPAAGRGERCVVEVTTATGDTERLGARLVINGMGATSPLTLALRRGLPFTGVCPTVGTVARGFADAGPRSVDLELGEILMTTGHADGDGRRQLMWEGFPGREDELTVYLFYYDRVRPGQPQSLLELFEVYFARLAEYKAPGPHFQHCRPVYGFIPSHHGATLPPTAHGILAIGDAAAQQSPLTFCGFGSHVRNLARVADLADFALRHDLLDADSLRRVTSQQSNVSLMWVFARFLQPWRGGSEVNDLMNRFLGALAVLGESGVRRFFQDRTTWRDYTRVLVTFGVRWPVVFVWALEVLGWQGLRGWLRDYARFTRAALIGTLVHLLGRRGVAVVGRALDTARPAWGLRLRALAAEWNVSRPDPVRVG